MAVYDSPGVYISEKDYSEYSASSSTCTFGIVGEARRGPVGVPTLVTSQKELIDTFGEPVEGCYGIYSALQVLTQASNVYYLRVVRSATKAKAGTSTSAILYEAVVEGTEGNSIVVTQNAMEDDVFSIKVVQGETEEVFSNLTFDSTDVDNYFVHKINDESAIVKVTDNYDAISHPYVPGELTLSGAVDTGACATAGAIGTDKITFTTTNFDSTLNSGSIHLSSMDEYGYFSLILYDKKGNEIESWGALSLDKEDDRYIEYIINVNSKRILATVNESSGIEYSEDTLYFTATADDGSDGISDADIIGESTGTGITAFSNVEMIRVDVLLVPGRTSPTVINKALEVCAQRGDTILIADTPFGLSASEVTDWTNGTGMYSDHASFNSSYGAFYWPWIQISDVYSKSNVWLPPSGFVGAQYAYNDRQAFPWYAPAGLNRGLISGALALEKSPTKGERDLVYGNRNIVNPIANVLGQGLVIWGQKTMQRKPTALDRVNVRRCLNYLERTVGDALKYYVFEQNTPATWDRAKTLINPILANVKSNNGLYEYKIVISPSPDDIENNRMPVTIYVKPTKTAEYIPLTFNVMPYGASFDKI